MTDRNATSTPHCLVTGGAGFIGSHTVDALLARGARVTVLDDLSSGHRANLPASATFHEGSILDGDALARAVSDVDAVVHLAAEVSVAASVDDPAACHARNVEGTARVLEAARHAGVRRVVFASSCAVYGAAPALPSVERDPVLPASPYAATKAAGEALVAAYGRTYELDTMCFRYFNVFGPRQDPNSAYAAVIAAFSDAIHAGRAPVIFGDGTQSRDFVPVEMVAWCNAEAALRPDRFDGAIVNLGTGVGTSLRGLLDAMTAFTTRSIETTFAAPRAGDVPHSRADITALEQWFSARPRRTLHDGLTALMRPLPA